MAQKKSMKKSHAEERKEPYNALNRTEQDDVKQELSEK